MPLMGAGRHRHGRTTLNYVHPTRHRDRLVQRDMGSDDEANFDAEDELFDAFE